jgi:hypothetical protein
MAKGRQNQLQDAGCPSLEDGQEVEYAVGIGRHGRPDAAGETQALSFVGSGHWSAEDTCTAVPPEEDVTPDVDHEAAPPEARAVD